MPRDTPFVKWAREKAAVLGIKRFVDAEGRTIMRAAKAKSPRKTGKKPKEK